MLTLAEMTEIVDSLYTKQADRLVRSNEGIEEFMKRPEEEAVTFEIDCYENLIESAEKAATT